MSSITIDILPTKWRSHRHRSTPCRRSGEAIVIDRHPADEVEKLSLSIDTLPTESGSRRHRLTPYQRCQEVFYLRSFLTLRSGASPTQVQGVMQA